VLRHGRCPQNGNKNDNKNTANITLNSNSRRKESLLICDSRYAAGGVFCTRDFGLTRICGVGDWLLCTNLVHTAPQKRFRRQLAFSFLWVCAIDLATLRRDASGGWRCP